VWLVWASSLSTSTKVGPHGAFWDMVIEQEGKEVVSRSAEQCLRAIDKE
jgi:hypothetical protein